MRRVLIVFSAVVTIVVLACIPGWAQGTAQISGTVTDNSGAVLAGATVTATQTDTGVARDTTSNEAGVYVLPDLPIGPYRLEVVVKGFRTFVQTGIILEVQASPVINPRLQVGEVAQTVQVTENAPLVETEQQGVVGEVMENQRILDLPLNGRNINDLMLVSAGTTTGVNTNGSRDIFNAPLTGVSIAGGLSFGIAYTLDGAMHNNPFSGMALSEPFPDATQEFKIETSAISAGSGGVHSAGLVSLVTKSGTNSIHGDLFEFVRNYAFNARDAFATGPDTLKRNQFGGVIGGPIKKNKLFFFAGYQGTLISQNNANIIGIVPTADMLAGNFTAFASPACNGGRQITLKAPFVNNMINPALFSPAGLAFAEKLPQSSNPCGTVTYANPVEEHEHMGIAKVDYQLSAKQSIFVRYLVDNIAEPTPYQFDQSLLSASVNGSFGQNQALTLSHTYILRTNLINVFRLTGNRSNTYKSANDTFSECSLGIKIYCGYDSGLPGLQDLEKISVTGGIAANVSAGPTGVNIFAITDDLNWTRGNHQYTLGGAVSKWNTVWTGCIACIANIGITGATTGQGYADLLTGNVATVVQGPPDVLGSYEWYLGLYINDTWKANRRLTVNLGLRWEPYFPQVPNTGWAFNLSIPGVYEGVRTQQYANAPPGLLYPGDPGYPAKGKSIQNPQLGDVGPRVGLAWDVRGDGRTSVRASFGIFYDVVTAVFPEAAAAPPFEPFLSLFGVKLDNPWASTPGGNPFPVSTGFNAPFPVPSNYKIYPLNNKNPEIAQWNLSVQKQLKTNWMVSVSYIGTESSFLPMVDNVNPAVYLGLGSCTLNGVMYNPCSTTSNTSQRRALALAIPTYGQDYGYIYQEDDGGTANYNGLVVSVQHRLSNGYTVTANYTLAHCISDPVALMINPLSLSQPYTVPNDPRADRGNCNTTADDVRNVFSLTSVLQTPKFSNPTLRRIGSYWSVAPLVKIQSGDALALTTSTDVALSGNVGAQRVSQVLPNANVFGTGLQYFNPKAFALPATGSYSNIPPGKFHGPGYANLDFAIFRDFHIGEVRFIEARVEAFNATNTFDPVNPVTNFNSGQFGQVTSDHGPRIMQFALKYVF